MSDSILSFSHIFNVMFSYGYSMFKLLILLLWRATISHLYQMKSTMIRIYDIKSWRERLSSKTGNALLSLYFVAPIYKYKYLLQLVAWCFRNYSVYAVDHCCYLEGRLFRWLWCYGWNTLHSLIFKYHYSSSPNNNGFSF